MADTETPPTSTCRSCHATIRWAVTKSGKWMPVNADPDPNGSVTLGGLVETSRGKVPRALTVPTGQTGMVDTRYMPHHATCPQGATWRRRDQQTTRPVPPKGGPMTDPHEVVTQAASLADRLLEAHQVVREAAELVTRWHPDWQEDAAYHVDDLLDELDVLRGNVHKVRDLARHRRMAR